MKKQFFYAALAIALMSSCSKDNDPGTTTDPVNPNPGEVVDEGTPVAIELGVNSPQVSVSTRGMGAAGTEESAGIALWDEQELKILMTKKNSLILAKEDPNDDATAYIFDGLTFKAPAKTVTTAENMKIKNTFGAIKYYPLQGAYDFYGFSFDDAVVEGGFSYPEKTEADKTIEYNLTIDGTQDIMIAKAELTDAQKDATTGSGVLAPADEAKAYSSWAARRNIQPIMNFKHLLARLDFKTKVGETVAGGDEITVNDINYATTWPAADGYPQPIGNKLQNGVYVKSIKILNPKSKITVKIADLDNPATAGITTSAADATITDFTLMRKPTSTDTQAEQDAKKLLPLIWATPGIAKDAELPIGNGIMIVPGENTFEMEIELMQYVKEYDGTDTAHPESYTWKTAKLQSTVTLNKLDATQLFAAGNYYTITVTTFGFQAIEVTATLSKWVDGGNIDTNPEDDAFN